MTTTDDPEERKQIEVVALLERVRKGNDKLWNAWKYIRDWPGTKEEKEKMYAGWQERVEFLNKLCFELAMKGFTDCLYIDENGKKTKGCLYNQDNPLWFCNTCPVQHSGPGWKNRYWEKELDFSPNTKVETAPASEGSAPETPSESEKKLL